MTAVLDTLAPFVQADHDDLVTACDRYLRRRLDHLDYQGALQRGLPIGSGEIESAHRDIIQERLTLAGAWWSPYITDNSNDALNKERLTLAGAWWSPAHIETMLALRLSRANREWEDYWQGIEKEAA